ncbi:MAG: DUF3226 domain-containing protein [Cetobacterium sp.]
MKKYMIYVEGFHDLGVIGKCFENMGCQKIEEKKDLNQIFSKLLPVEYPFSPTGKMDRIADIPDFYKFNGNEISLKSANKESKIYSKIYEDLERVMSRKEISEIESILVIIDADGEDAGKKIEEFNNRYGKSRKNFEINKNMIIYKEIEIPLKFYVFPDNINGGVLEDIILECIPGPLIETTVDYIEEIEKKSEKAQSILNKGYSNRKKAIISCLGNVKISPSSSGTVYLRESDWIEKNISNNPKLLKLVSFLNTHLQ